MRLLQRPLSVFFIIGNLVFLAVVGLRATGTLEFAELAAYDFMLRLRPSPPSADPRIVLIGITENDIKRSGWPLPDEILAELLESLLRDQARVVGLDLYRDQPVLAGYDQLKAVLTSNENIFGVMKFGAQDDQRAVAAPAALQETERVGFADVLADPGGVVRRGLLFLDDGENVAYSLPLRLALHYLQKENVFPQPGEPDPQYLRLGRVTLAPFEANDGGYVGADARGYQFLLDFEGAPANFSTYSLQEALSNKIPKQALQDKVVIIGVAAESVKDYFYTPFSRGLDADQRIFGITLHGHVTSQLLRSGLDHVSPVKTASELQEAAWSWLWAMMGVLLGFRIRSPWPFTMAATMGLVAIALVGFVALLLRWWIPVVPPALGWLITAAVTTSYMSQRENAQRGQLMNLFSRYVPRDVAESLWQHREQFLEGGRPRPQNLTATVFFSDLKGFTPVSERLDARELMDWLNEYMEAMAQLVMSHGGVVDKFIGDAIMAVFGIPLARTSESEIKQDAIDAVNCALAMQDSLEDLNVRWQARGLPTIGIRIGIFTGSLVAGSLGSSERMEYTVIGDTVNIASRLESIKDVATPDDSQSPCRILIGDATMRYLGEDFRTRPVGAVSLKGKQEKITVYHVIGRNYIQDTQLSN